MPTIEVRDITMQFPAVRALTDVSLVIPTGEIHGIVGENGAGKSTLMRILSGLQIPTQGDIVIDGKLVKLHRVRDASHYEIGMIHQELNLIGELTVAENVFLGREPKKGLFIDRKILHENCEVLLKQVGATFTSRTLVKDLSVAGKQLVEIAKALSLHASILIMDEPTAVLSEHESTSLFALIHELKTQGVTVLYISHRLQEVCDICDRITILRDGIVVATVDGKSAHPSELANQMVGREMSDFFPPKLPLPAPSDFFAVTNASVEGFVHGVSFSVSSGEILGLAGLVGSGRTELCEALIGARQLTGGSIQIEGEPVRIRSPKAAKQNGIAYVSEDRKGIGLILSLDVIQNTTLASLEKYGVIIDTHAEVETTDKCKAEFEIKAGDIYAPILFLSGGNQQKVSVAKWLQTNPRVLILDEPTRGVDVGAKRQMYEIIQRLAAQGLACIVISSEMQEIIGLCHRAIVLREGRKVGELAEHELNEENIMNLAAGVVAA